MARPRVRCPARAHIPHTAGSVVSEKPLVRTYSFLARAAHIALTAGLAIGARDLIAGFDAGHGLAHSNNIAGHLMAGHERKLDPIAVRALAHQKIMKTDAAGANANEDLITLRFATAPDSPRPAILRARQCYAWTTARIVSPIIVLPFPSTAKSWWHRSAGALCARRGAAQIPAPARSPRNPKAVTTRARSPHRGFRCREGARAAKCRDAPTTSWSACTRALATPARPSATSHQSHGLVANACRKLRIECLGTASRAAAVAKRASSRQIGALDRTRTASEMHHRLRP